jgi:NADPH:quinone reductase-like Zn-dependent oxidoreductase
MKAVVHERYGPPSVLRVAEVDPPVPGEDEVLIRVHASTVTRTDIAIRAAKPFFWRFFAGLRRPRRTILGIEFAGEVEAVGGAVTEFAPGDQVFGGTASRFGAHAELLCVRARGAIAHKPAGLSYEEAAAICDGGIQALAHLRRAEVGQGTRLLVLGASGSCGTAAVQLGKHFGAHVTGVCPGKSVEVVRGLGADEVVDYEQEDFTRNGQTYDVILDAVGTYSFRRCRRALEPGGLYVATDGLRNLPLVPLSRLGERRLVFAMPRYSKQDVLLLKELIEAGEYRAVIDRAYPLEDVVEATRHVETRHKTGNVVLTIP